MSQSKAQILLVEDDPGLGFVIQDTLKESGYTVHLSRDGKEGLKLFNSHDYDLCILDVMLPQKDGFELARDIRRIDKEVPIVFLTAKSVLQDKVEGFKSGGDDYITKPFSNQEFLLRVEALLRRSRGSRSGDEPKVHTIGNYMFDEPNLTLSLDGNRRSLTKKESAILKILAERKNQVIERELLTNLVWGDDSYFVGRSLDVFITKLRKHLADDPRVSITNVHGVGFKLEIDEDTKLSR